jgi:hypothetical protein
VNPIFSAALEIQEFCREKKWRFCFIGAIAVQRWGEPRLTQDVDLTLLTGFGTEETYVDQLLENFGSRIPSAKAFALRTRVLLLESRDGIPVDVAMGAMPFEERAVERATDFSIEDDASLTTCGAEDLIVFKAFANRDKDWLDIASIIIRQAGRLDEGLVWSELKPLVDLKQEPGITDRLTELLNRHRT